VIYSPSTRIIRRCSCRGENLQWRLTAHSTARIGGIHETTTRPDGALPAAEPDTLLLHYLGQLPTGTARARRTAGRDLVLIAIGTLIVAEILEDVFE
jgi:hypothetical protein